MTESTRREKNYSFVRFTGTRCLFDSVFLHHKHIQPFHGAPQWLEQLDRLSKNPSGLF